jgi:hypothetical protein
MRTQGLYVDLAPWGISCPDPMAEFGVNLVVCCFFCVINNYGIHP